jgi:hypothetical protein
MPGPVWPGAAAGAASPGGVTCVSKKRWKWPSPNLCFSVASATLIGEKLPLTVSCTGTSGPGRTCPWAGLAIVTRGSLLKEPTFTVGSGVLQAARRVPNARITPDLRKYIPLS